MLAAMAETRDFKKMKQVCALITDAACVLTQYGLLTRAGHVNADAVQIINTGRACQQVQLYTTGGYFLGVRTTGGSWVGL
jgi:hypothetical protein